MSDNYVYGGKFDDISISGGLDPSEGIPEINPSGFTSNMGSTTNIFNKILVGSDEYIFEDTSLADLVSTTNVSNPEWLKVIVDAENKVLCGIKEDGSFDWKKGIPDHVNEKFSKVNTSIDSLNVSIKFLDDNTNSLYDEQKHVYITLVTDASDNMLYGVTKDGTLDMRIKQDFKNDIIINKNIELSKTAAQNIFKSIKDGIGFNFMDWSSEKQLQLPLPYNIAKININAPQLPTAKSGLGTVGVTCDIPAELEYWDKFGNYFKKPILLSAQGSSSMNYATKNLGFDLDDGSKIKFGNWVEQDSFHIKKYYIDVFRGQCIVGYKLHEAVLQTRDINNRRPWSYLNVQTSAITGSGSISKDYDTGALGHPDGFPVMLYFNGEEQGVYTMNLKKHRDNYNCGKTKANNIILDGALGGNTLWGGNVSWGAFEIRNPKNLKLMDGSTAYDGEDPQEIGDGDTKTYIENLSKVVRNITVAATIEEKRNIINTCFNMPHFIDYILTSEVLYNLDGFNKNWIWVTYDGVKWAPTVYDLDSIFGMYVNGTYVVPDSTTRILSPNYSPCSVILPLFTSEIEERYAELRNKKIYDVDFIMGLLNDWLSRIGYENIKKETDKFPDLPSYRDNNINDGWELIEAVSNDASHNINYNNSIIYNIGDECIYGHTNGRARFRSTKQQTGNKPCEIYTRIPYVLGVYNTPIRVRNWLTARLETLDVYYHYTPNN